MQATAKTQVRTPLNSVVRVRGSEEHAPKLPRAVGAGPKWDLRGEKL